METKIYKRYTIGLSLYRVVLSFLVLKNSIFFMPMADELFGTNAIAPLDVYYNTMSASGLSFLAYPFHLPFAAHFILIILIVSSIMFMLGIYGRFSGIVLFICLFILQRRNGYILDGSDNVMAVTLPFLIFANSFDHLSYKRKHTNQFLKKVSSSKVSKTVLTLSVLGLMIQICYVYLFTALHKLQGTSWLNGTAIYYTMRVNEFRATSFNILLTENHYFVVLTTYFTVFWELSFAFLVWFKQTRYFILVLGVILHIGIWIFMRIDNFSWIMIGSYLFFIENHDYRLAKRKVVRMTKIAYLKIKRFVHKKEAVSSHINK